LPEASHSLLGIVDLSSSAASEKDVRCRRILGRKRRRIIMGRFSLPFAQEPHASREGAASRFGAGERAGTRRRAARGSADPGNASSAWGKELEELPAEYEPMSTYATTDRRADRAVRQRPRILQRIDPDRGKPIPRSPSDFLPASRSEHATDSPFLEDQSGLNRDVHRLPVSPLDVWNHRAQFQLRLQEQAGKQRVLRVLHEISGDRRVPVDLGETILPVVLAN